MAISLTFSLQNACAGGGHAFVSVSVDGEAFDTRKYTIDDLLSSLTRDEKNTFIELAIRASLTGLTKVQARNKLQAGITVNIQ